MNNQRPQTHIERLAAIGKLASKVAHELNNPLDGILRYINLTMRIVEKENLEKPKEYLNHCRQALMRMIQIVSELLEFSRSTCASLQEYNKIEQIIDDAVRTMVSSADISSIRVSKNYTADIPPVRSGNLFQVFCNLIKNAVTAMPEGGELTISTQKTEDSVIIKFHDTGTGFPAENTELIFEPFFTTKQKGKGTGLGLAVCKDIVERYNGKITAENAPDKGSIFTVYLPIEDKNL